MLATPRMPSAPRLASLVALVAPLVSSSGCVCKGPALFQCYHQGEADSASESMTETDSTDSTDSGSTDSTDSTDSSMSMSQSETMEPTCNMNGRCDEGESITLCPEECSACGNGELDEGEVCDEGAANSKDNAYHDGTPDTAPCNSSCTGKVPHCGDGTCQLDEDANSCEQDGCMPTCGNGAVETGEDCDDGNLVNTDACLNNCKEASCGDGFVEAGVEECDDKNDVENDACTNVCKMATCGDGLVWAGVEDCDDANDVEIDACDASCKVVVHRKVFVSSLQFNGKLGGLAGADARCQTLAAVAGLSGDFKAWLSDSTTGPLDRFDTAFTGVYELVNGTLVAHGWMDLTDGTLTHAIDLPEVKMAIPVNTTVWSSTKVDGDQIGMNHCMNWSSLDGGTLGSYGSSAATGDAWTTSASFACSAGFNLYCFEDPA